MAIEKKIVITMTPRTKDKIPYFDVDASNMEKYEVIGILELAIHAIKEECSRQSKTIEE